MDILQDCNRKTSIGFVKNMNLGQVVKGMPTCNWLATKMAGIRFNIFPGAIRGPEKQFGQPGFDLSIAKGAII